MTEDITTEFNRRLYEARQILEAKPSRAQFAVAAIEAYKLFAILDGHAMRQPFDTIEFRMQEARFEKKYADEMAEG